MQKMVLNRHIMLLVTLALFTFFEGNFFFKSCRKPLFPVLWNLRVKSTQFLGRFKWCPTVYYVSTQRFLLPKF